MWRPTFQAVNLSWTIWPTKLSHSGRRSWADLGSRPIHNTLWHYTLPVWAEVTRRTQGNRGTTTISTIIARITKRITMSLSSCKLSQIQVRRIGFCTNLRYVSCSEWRKRAFLRKAVFTAAPSRLAVPRWRVSSRGFEQWRLRWKICQAEVLLHKFGVVVLGRNIVLVRWQSNHGAWI